MSAPESLKDVYLDEMKDLWSANDQMTKVIRTLSEQVSDKALRKMLDGSVEGIGKHTETLKSLIEAAGGEVEKEHCKGMEGLCKEALKHGIKEAPEEDDLKAIGIISQYQRMSHYGLAGFGSAAAYAKALGMRDAAGKLSEIVADIYKADEYGTHLAERVTRLAARHEKAAKAG